MASVLVTGCSSGFGKLTALAFARHGHSVTAAVADPGRAGPMAELAAEEGLDVRVVTIDVTDAASVDAGVGAVGPVDVVVVLPSMEVRGPVEHTSDDEVRAQFEADVFGLVRVVRAVLPGMRKRGSGVLVVVSSIAGVVARPFGGVYSASRHAIEAVSEALHHEVRPYGIRVAVVEPGQFETEQLGGIVRAEAFDEASPYREASDRFDVALRRLVPDGKPAPAEVVVDTIVAVAFDDGAGLRTLVGADADLVLSVRRSGDFEHFERTLRGALGWED